MDILKKYSGNKLLFFRITLVVVFFGLGLRFFYVQIVEREKYFKASNKNRVRQITLAAPRGLILDRYGEILVDNLPAYSVFAIPNEMTNKDSIFALLGKLLRISPTELQRRYRKDRRGPFQRVKLAKYIDFPALARLEERKMDLPGIVFDVEPRRFYPSGVQAPHIFGYLGEISEEELRQLKKKGYEKGDIIGKKGLEKIYEPVLRGEKGYRFVEVDALGREIQVLREWGEKAPRPGKNLYLSIDAQLQRYLESTMQNKRGGAVVLNCTNGEVIAMVSKPDYNPEIFTKPIPPKTWDLLANNPAHPLFDRMVQSLYPPGSTYKLILAIAGLEKGIIDPNETIFCRGYLRLGTRKFKCWKKSGHGKVNLLKAIEESCNVYFFRMMQKVGLSLWVEYSRKFHFGEKTGIDLVGESPGLVPDSSYFNKRYGKGKWSRGLLLNLSVGQGDLLVTPLQMATFAMAIANRGLSFRPHLVRGLVDSSNGEEVFFKPDTVRISGIHQRTWDLIHQGMYRVVNGAHGTARRAKPGIIKMAGKSGTAQNPHGDSHAWFIGFAPYEDPQVAFAIFIENGGSGGAKAAPIARGLLRLLLKNKKIKIPTPLTDSAD